MQVGRVQRLAAAAARCHQQSDFGECAAGNIAAAGDGLLHVAQIRTAMACLISRDQVVNLSDHRLGMPLRRAAIPVIESNLAAEMQHQCIERRCRIEVEAHCVQFFLAGHQFGAEPAQVLDQHQGMLLLFVKPHRHKGAKVAVITIVAQEHFRGRQCGPLGDGIHLDRERLLVG